MGRSKAGKSSPSKTRRYQMGESITKRNKERKKKKYEKEREKWKNDKEYQEKQRLRAIKLGRIKE